MEKAKSAEEANTEEKPAEKKDSKPEDKGKNSWNYFLGFWCEKNFIW